MDYSKRTFSALSPTADGLSPENKKPMHSGEETNMAAMAPPWFTHAMAGVNQQLQILSPMQAEIQGITNSLNFLGQEVDDAKANSAAALSKIQDLEHQLGEQKRVNAQLRIDLEKSNQYNTEIELYSRRSNLNFDNIVESPNEKPIDSERKVLRIIQDALGIDTTYIKVKRCHRYGIKSPNRPRPIKIRFNWYKDRVAVWLNKAKLKGSNIFIREDFPQSIDNKRSTLRPFFNAARKSKLFQKVFLRIDKLIIDNRAYNVNQLDNLPIALHQYMENNQAQNNTAQHQPPGPQQHAGPPPDPQQHGAPPPGPQQHATQPSGLQQHGAPPPDPQQHAAPPPDPQQHDTQPSTQPPPATLPPATPGTSQSTRWQQLAFQYGAQHTESLPRLNLTTPSTAETSFADYSEQSTLEMNNERPTAPPRPPPPRSKHLSNAHTRLQQYKNLNL